MRPGERERVVVGMSGGVDSSVAAALLVEAGYDVIGIAMRLWSDESSSGCCSLDDFLDARRVAAVLGIPFYVMDFRTDFQRRVVVPFVSEYLNGRTPNPCARCNQFVKFGTLWERARQLGARWVATGHYARVVRRAGGKAELWAGADADKDQSYFLFAIEPAVLACTLLPLGDMRKVDVRLYARRRGLPVADKHESQEVCFAPKGNYAQVVERHAGELRARPGPIIDRSGRQIGRHEGVHRFTVGQRRGLGLSAGQPLYVSAIDPETATVTVGRRDDVVAGGLIASGASWLCERPVPAGSRVRVKIRSRFAPAEALVTDSGAAEFTLRVSTGLPAVTPGQAAVLYDGERVVGGGWIERALPLRSAPHEEFPLG